MGNEVEARTQRVRNHLQRPDHPDRQLTDAKVGSTVNRTAPPFPRDRTYCAACSGKVKRLVQRLGGLANQGGEALGGCVEVKGGSGMAVELVLDAFEVGLGVAG